MKNIFLIDGASGTGKSDLLEYIETIGTKSGFLIKATTRTKRDYEKERGVKLDLDFYSQEEFDALNLDYTYPYEKYFYGFSKSQLDNLIQSYNNIFVIIRSIPIMRMIKKDYSNNNIVTIYVHSDISLITERLQKQNYNKTQIDFRVSRINSTFEDYVLNSSFFDEVIVNNSDQDNYHTLINNLVLKYSQ